jgi:hypothetical protein
VDDIFHKLAFLDQFGDQGLKRANACRALLDQVKRGFGPAAGALVFKVFNDCRVIFVGDDDADRLDLARKHHVEAFGTGVKHIAPVESGGVAVHHLRHVSSRWRSTNFVRT